MKLGLIQSRGVGDIIIALPIARYYADKGHTVIWPIDQNFLSSFQPAAPYVRFIGLNADDRQWMFEIPLEMLRREGCERIIPLYSAFSGRDDVVLHKGIASILKFDQYKYAIADVPFRQKWNLAIARDKNREEQLFRDVVRSDRYLCCHLEGSNVVCKGDVGALAGGMDIVHITPKTSNIFDWLTVIERCSVFVGIDSCVSNLVDQLNLPMKKYFIRRSSVSFTPVFINDWIYI